MNAFRNLLPTSAKKAALRPEAVATSGDAALPSLSDVSAAYAAALQNQKRLFDRQRALQAERIELLKIVVPGHDQPTTDPRDARVAQMAGVAPPARHLGERQRLSAVDQELEDIKAALDITKSVVLEERIKASRLLCETVADRHRELLLELTGHLSAAFTAWRNYTALIDELRNGQVAYAALRPQTPDFLGRHPNVPDSEVRLWLRDVAAAGFIEKSDLPEGCR